MCISGNALSPFIDNVQYDNKGIEMLHHLVAMKHPTSKSSASTVYNALARQKITPNETFDDFAKKLRIMYKTCTRAGIPYDEGYLIRCFIQGLDHNYDHTRELLDNGVLPWYDLTLNEVIIYVTDIKMNKMSTGTWLTTPANAHAVGQQGAKRPESQPNMIPVDPEVPAYPYKTSDLSWSDVGKLLKRFSCPLCRRNNHPFHLCNALKSTYSIKLKSTSDNPPTNTQSAAVPTQAPAANYVSDTLPYTIEDTPTRYEGFENISNPPPHSDSDNSTATTEDVTEALSTSLKNSKINNSSIPYLQQYSKLKYHLGSVKHAHVSLPVTTHSFKTSFNTTTDYPVIIDSCPRVQ